MVKEFDEKGKIYTNVIPKLPVSVILQTDLHRIKGYLHIRPDERIKDELNRSEKFIAITGAVISDIQGNVLYRCEFLTLNSDQIHWLIPEEDGPSELTPGGN